MIRSGVIRRQGTGRRGAGPMPSSGQCEARNHLAACYAMVFETPASTTQLAPWTLAASGETR